MRCRSDARGGVHPAERWAGMALVVATTWSLATAQVPAAPRTCDACGVVQSVKVSSQEESWAPLGVVSSGASTVSGATSQGRSMFSLDGQRKPELVVVGAAGGAVYAKRPTSYQRQRWDVTVRLDSGATRVLPQRYEPLVREGDRVRIAGTQVELVD